MYGGLELLDPFVKFLLRADFMSTMEFFEAIELDQLLKFKLHLHGMPLVEFLILCDLRLNRFQALLQFRGVEIAKSI